MSAVQYVQAAGVPAMMYGIENVGISDATLKKTIGLAAAAVTPPTMGKNSRLALHAVAPLCTAADHSYAAHVTPIKTWATAFWDGWASRTDMKKACQYAANKVNGAKGTAWNLVHGGPATALAATCRRIG